MGGSKTDVNAFFPQKHDECFKTSTMNGLHFKKVLPSLHIPHNHQSTSAINGFSGDG